MINFGLLGCGRIGQVHARGLSQIAGARLVAVCDAQENAAKKVAQQYNTQVRSAEEIIKDKDIDAVIIGTPTDTHLDLIRACAQAGKAIFCEKPIENTIERIKECQSIVDKHKVPFMTAFNRRFDPNFQRLQTRIQAGEIGKVELVSIISRDPAPPPIEYIKTSGGLFRDMMIHDFDMARFLLGEDITALTAAGSCLVDKAIGAAGDVDTAAVVMTTASGAICQISNSRRAVYGYDQRVEVHGAGGLLRAENAFEDGVELANADGFRRAPLQHFFLERYEIAYRQELAYFAGAVAGGETLRPSLSDGIKAQMLAEAAVESLRTSKTVVISDK